MMDEFLKFDIDQFIEEHQQEVIIEVAPEAAEMLSEAVGSDDAKSFTTKMNEIYEKRDQLDADGNPLQIETPLNLINRMVPNSDGSVRFTLTPAEDRWFRANQLYGSNIIGKAGFRYEVEE